MDKICIALDMLKAQCAVQRAECLQEREDLVCHYANQSHLSLSQQFTEQQAAVNCVLLCSNKSLPWICLRTVHAIPLVATTRCLVKRRLTMDHSGFKRGSSNKELAIANYALGSGSVPHCSLTVSNDETNWIPRKP
jgi:hypothetical protein